MKCKMDERNEVGKESQVYGNLNITTNRVKGILTDLKLLHQQKLRDEWGLFFCILQYYFILY